MISISYIYLKGYNKYRNFYWLFKQYFFIRKQNTYGF